jgi:hypothetical protein
MKSKGNLPPSFQQGSVRRYRGIGWNVFTESAGRHGRYGRYDCSSSHSDYHLGFRLVDETPDTPENRSEFAQSQDQLVSDDRGVKCT